MKRILSFLLLPALLSMLLLSGAADARHARGGASGTPTGGGATQIFTYPSGFAGASGQIHPAWGAAFNGSAIYLIPGAAHSAGTAWYNIPQNVQSFTTDFTFQQAGTAFGMTFTVQNSTAATSPNSYGINAQGAANGEGYFGFVSDVTMTDTVAIGKSVAVMFDRSGGDAYINGTVNPQSATGLYVVGGPAIGWVPQEDLIPQGLDLNLGDLMSAHIVYDGTLYTMVLTDTVTGVSVRKTWPVDVPTVVGANTALVGFTAGSGIGAAGLEQVLTWTWSQGYNTRLATPTFSVTPGSYTSAQTVSVSGPAGSTIYYTTNGIPPTTNSTLYTGPITVSSSEVIEAVAVQSNFTDSLVASGNYQIAAGGTPIINFPSGFASSAGLMILNGSASLSGSNILLVQNTTTDNTAGTAWFPVPVGVGTFTTNFTMQFTSPYGCGNIGRGLTFAIQNQLTSLPSYTTMSGNTYIGGPNYITGGPFAMSAGNGMGYAGQTTDGTSSQQVGLLNSVAVKFDIEGGTQNDTGLYTDGSNLNTGGTTITGISLCAKNPIQVSMVYNGTVLAMMMTDTVTHATYSQPFTVDIPGTIGGSKGWIGFTAGTDFHSVNAIISNWTYTTP